MGVFASYTQVSEKSFENIKRKILNKESVSLEDYKIDEIHIKDTFLGLQYILTKGCGEKLDNLFGGGGIICSVDFNSDEFNNLTQDEKFEVFETTLQESYLSPGRIAEIYEIVKNLEENQITDWYSSKELNENKIHPQVWHDDNSENKVFNQRDVINCFTKWRSFLFKVNSKKSDCIIIR